MAYPPPNEQGPNQSLDGDWLCNSGPYFEYINYLCKHQPSLRRQDPGNWFAPVCGRSAKIAFLELNSNGRTEPRFFKTVQELTPYLPSPHTSENIADEEQ